MPPEGKRDYLVAYVSDMILVAKAAEEKKITDDADFKRRLAYLRNKLLMETMLHTEAKAAVTDAAMRKVYDEATKQMAGEQEVRARHILVETEDEAKAVLAELKKGTDFAELAKLKSKDPGAAEGGDLGYFTKDQMVPEFSETAFKLEKGQLSDPVKSRVRLARHPGRGQARPSGSGVRAGEGSDRELRDAQGAGRDDRQAARGREDRAARSEAGRPARSSERGGGRACD